MLKVPGKTKGRGQKRKLRRSVQRDARQPGKNDVREAIFDI